MWVKIGPYFPHMWQGAIIQKMCPREMGKKTFYFIMITFHGWKIFLEYDIYLNINTYAHCLPFNIPKLVILWTLG